MKVEEKHVYGTRKDDVEGYIELSELTSGMFDISRQGWYYYIRYHVGAIYKVYSDNIKLFSSFTLYTTLMALKKGGNFKYEY